MQFLKRHFEIFLLPIAILLWVYSGKLIRLIDPTAGNDDLGFLQMIIFKLVTFLLLSFFIKLFMRLAWSTVDRYLSLHFSNDFNDLPAWLKVIISVVLYSSFYLTLALL